jgi:hypothetical protein
LFGFCLALISFPQAQTITSISPTSGVAGTRVTITGTSLACPSGWSCSLSLSNNIVSWTNTTIVAIVPLGLPANTTTVPVFTSYTGRWEGEDAQSNTVYFTLLQPLITSISPTTVRPGTQVTMNGAGFGATQGSSTVTFNGITTPVVSWSDTQIVATVPSGATSGAITVSVQGLSPVTSPHLEVWPYIASITPSSGGVGTELEIHGEGLNPAGLVHCLSVNGWPTAETYWSDTLIRIKIRPGSIPATATSVPISIDYWFDDDWGGGYLDKSSNTYNFTIAQAPITSLVPATGRPTDIVTINGSNFGAAQGQSAVTFGSVPAQVNSWSDSQIRAVVPEGVPDGYVFVNVPGLGAGASWFSLLPWIKSTEPAVAVPNTLLTIQGQGLLPGAFNLQGLRINGSSVSTESWTDSQIVVRVPNQPPGSVSIAISADYSYCDDYDGCLYGETSNTIQVPVAQVLPSNVILTTSSTPASFCNAVILTAALIPSSATGTITFMDGSSTLGIATVVAGVATYTTSSFAVGTHSITAVYSGDLAYAPSTSAVLTQTVNKATSSVVLTSSLNPSLFGQSVTVTATTTAGATGTVTFQDAGVTLGTVELSGNAATYTTSALSVGSHQLTAVYSGDSNFDTNSSAVLAQNVSSPIQIFGLSPNSGAPGTTVTITGSGFGSTIPANAAVLLGSVALSVLDWSDTAIRVSIPGTAISGTVSVTVRGTTVAGPEFIVTVTPVLKVRVEDSPASVNLSDSANLDWIVWGADGSTAATRKSGVPALLSDLTLVNGSQISADTLGYVGFTWSDGTSQQNATNIYPEVWTTSANAAIRVIAPADTTTKTLKLYAGTYKSAKLDVSIGDNSSSPVTIPINSSVELNQTYSIDFRAASPGQTVTVTLTSTDADGYVAISAATVGLHVPDLTLAPLGTNLFQYPADVPITAEAAQYDATVATVQLLGDAQQLFELDSEPYSATWSNVPPGHHSVGATATDENGLTATAKPIEFDVLQSGGTLTSTFETVSSPVDLTAEGTADWRLWGCYLCSVPQDSVLKAGVVSLISDFKLIGNHRNWTRNWTSPSDPEFLFSDGAPITDNLFVTQDHSIGVQPGVEVDGTHNGFEIQIAADTQMRTLRLYAGLGWARARMTAFLSDGSAPVVSDASFDEQSGMEDGVYSIGFKAASAGQKLTVRLTLDEDHDWGDLDLIAATLDGEPVIPPGRPWISSISATANEITISGSAFGEIQGSGYVVLNNLYGLVMSWSDTQIVVAMQSGTLSGNLYVHQNGFNSNVKPFSSLWPNLAPAIASVSPPSGIIGDSIYINGVNFGAVHNATGTVLINGVQTYPSSWNDTSIVVPVPYGATTGNIVVSVNGLTSNAVAFTVSTPTITALSPTAGPAGTVVTIEGTDFGPNQGSGNVQFDFYGTIAPVISWSDTSIVVTVPSRAMTGNILVYRANGVTSVSSNAVPFTVTSSTPVINSLSPASGLPGKVITIAGINFGSTKSDSTVTFNGVAAAPTTWSTTAITVAVPEGATSGNVVVTVNGVSTNGMNFMVPSLSSVSVTPKNPLIAVGTHQQFSATGTYSDGSTQLIRTATWSSSVVSVSSIDASGNATAIAQGQSVIQATVGDILGSTTLNVASALGSFVSTGKLVTPRGGHTATLLTNGQILIAGGQDSNSKNLSGAELYNPVTGTFAATRDMTLARKGHTASLLNNGMVLITGGQDSQNVPTASAEMYDPSTGAFFATGNLNTPRQYATATLLPSGQVLIVGGQGSLGSLSSAEIFDPASGTFTATGNLNTERVYHAATLLTNGTVLIVGGQSNTAAALAAAEIYDSATGLFTPTTSNPNDARRSPTIALLNNGMVLISQGLDGSSTILSTAELYDPSSGAFSYVDSPYTPRNGSSATLLGNGNVLMAGGSNQSVDPLVAAENYDSVSGIFTTAANAITARALHTGTLFTDGNVLLAGGLDNNLKALDAAELYQPGSTTPPGLVSIIINPSSSSLPIGTAQRFAATGTFTDGSSQALASVSWSSSASTIASVTSDLSNRGTVYALAAGSTTVSACAGAICGTATVTVPASQLTTITLAPGSAVLPIGSTTAFRANGTYENGSTVDLTSVVTWSSGLTSVATINTKGFVTGIAKGTATIRATYGTTTATATLNVVSPISYITITPTNPFMHIGAFQQFTATARYNDGTSGDITATAQWSSQVPEVATVTSGGSVSTLRGGSSTITVSSGGRTASTTLTVTAPVVTITNISRTGIAGMQVTINGSGFGDGPGMVWLGTLPGVVVSWSDNQVVATVAPGSNSGTVRIQHDGIFSNSIAFTVQTATITDIAPLTGVEGTEVIINGYGFRNDQGSGQVWLGTASALVKSWSDTQVIATVAAGSSSGGVQILQNGVWSNSVPFTVTGAPHISGITPNSGPIGTVATIRGTGFGSAESNGFVWVGGKYASVMQWSDALVVASVPDGAVSGVIKIQQNGVWSNSVAFTVRNAQKTIASMTMVPNVLNLVVGETRTVQVVDANSRPLTGLTWTSSDTNVMSLSTDDPPVLTALHPGTTTVTAGDASADVTVYSGATLPLGTVIWSNPGDSSGVSSILPAVPSDKGVADVFAVNNSGNVQAIRSDGTVGWTVNIPMYDPYFLPDFQGGLVAFDVDANSIKRLDGITGQAQPAYAPSDSYLGYPAIHTDGTIFIPEFGHSAQGQNWVAGIDPTIGRPKFKVPTISRTDYLSVTGEACSTAYQTGRTAGGVMMSDPIIAGDGFAYVTYKTYHASTFVQDAVQTQPIQSFSVFKRITGEIQNRQTNAAIGDIGLLKAILGLRPLSVTQPNDTWDLMANAVYEGRTADANTYVYSKASDFSPLCNSTGSNTEELHVLKVGSDGSSVDTIVQQWQSSFTKTYGRDPYNPKSFTITRSGDWPSAPWSYIITNADQGALLSWAVRLDSYCAFTTDAYSSCPNVVDERIDYHLTTLPGGDVTWPAAVPGQDWYAVEPVLQLADGTYIGTAYSGNTHAPTAMLKFDTNGNILRAAGPGLLPQIATAYGGVIAGLASSNGGVIAGLASSNGEKSSGAGITFDNNLNVTGQMASLPIQSWKGAYQKGRDELGSVIPTFDLANIAQTFAAVPGGNLTGNGFSLLHHTFGLIFCRNCGWMNSDPLKSLYQQVALGDPNFPANAHDFSNDYGDWVDIVKFKAIRAFVGAFEKLPAIVSRGYSASMQDSEDVTKLPFEHTVFVVGDWLGWQGRPPIDLPPNGRTDNNIRSRVYYLPIMAGAEDVLGLKPPYPPPPLDNDPLKINRDFVSLFNGIGTAIGNVAVHETAHQLTFKLAITGVDCDDPDNLDAPLCQPADGPVYERYKASDWFFKSEAPVMHWLPNNVLCLENYFLKGGCTK